MTFLSLMMVNLNFHLSSEDFVVMGGMFSKYYIPNKPKWESKTKFQKFCTPHKANCGSGMYDC